MTKYPLVISGSKYFYIFPSRWTLFPICIETKEIIELLEKEGWEIH